MEVSIITRNASSSLLRSFRSLLPSHSVHSLFFLHNSQQSRQGVSLSLCSSSEHSQIVFKERYDIGFKNLDPSSLGRRTKRKQVVVMAPKRLHSEEEDLGFMQKALAEARKGAKNGEVLVGAVLVHNKKTIARFHNQCYSGWAQSGGNW